MWKSLTTGWTPKAKCAHLFSSYPSSHFFHFPFTRPSISFSTLLRHFLPISLGFLRSLPPPFGFTLLLNLVTKQLWSPSLVEDEAFRTAIFFRLHKALPRASFHVDWGVRAAASTMPGHSWGCLLGSALNGPQPLMVCVGNVLRDLPAPRCSRQRC